MGYSLVLGNDVVVSAEEFNEKMSLGTLARFGEEAQRNEDDAVLEFQEGVLSAGELESVEDSPLAFEPIGIGKPISIEILGFYTGELPFRFGFGKSDLMVSSAIKSIETYGAQPKAVNQIARKVDNFQLLRPSAEAVGSPIVYYKPSLVNSTLLCDITLIADSFDERVFGYLSSLLKKASGLPVFIAGPQGAAAASVALAGSMLANLTGELGKLFAESKATMHSPIELRFDTPDFFQVKPGTIVVYNTRDARKFSGYAPKLVDGGKPTQYMVMMKDGEEYEGDAPYVILSLDGRQRNDLDDFSPTVASAALLEQFLGGEDPGGQAVVILEQAMQLFNDFTYNQKGSAIKSAIDALDKESATYDKDLAELEQLLAAYNQNIQHDVFSVQ